MISSTFTFNKTKRKMVVLLHGLFANAGFWLDSMVVFSDYKIIAPSISYGNSFDLQLVVSEIEKTFLDNDDREVMIVSHSLGCVIASSLSAYQNMRIFRICPVDVAIRISDTRFTDEIFTRLGGKIDRSSIHRHLHWADRILERINCRVYPDEAPRIIDFIPDKDDYFIYLMKNETKVFSGNHFGIKNAIKAIEVEMSA